MFGHGIIGNIFCPPGAGNGGSLSGFAGVISIEGLSGIVDLFSPGNSILIGTSGQIITLDINPSSSFFDRFRPVDARPVSGSIVPDSSGIYSIGAPFLRFSHIFAQSGVFGLVQYDILTSQPAPINNGAFWLRQQNNQIIRPQYLTPSGTKTIRSVDGYANYISSSTNVGFIAGDGFIAGEFDTASVLDTQYFSSVNDTTFFVWADGLYKISYNLVFESVGSDSDAIIQSRILRNGSTSIDGSEGFVSIVNDHSLRFGQINKEVLVNLNAGDNLQFEAQLFNGVGGAQFYEDSSFTIEYIRV